MSLTNPMDLSLVELSAAVQAGRITPTESIRACLDRISQRDPSVNAVAHLCADRALAEAERQTAALARGRSLGALAGVPFLVKDLEDARGLPTSYGSRRYKGRNIAKEDSPQVERLRAAGGIVVGKATTALFGGNAGCNTKAFGATRNPWRLDKTPGGSSGGSAAAVAARMVPLATAADAGGSIRIPAAFCGLFGIKPTYGLVPMTELRQFRTAHFMHCPCFGPVTRSVHDAALYLDAVCGPPHPSDPWSLPRPIGPSFAEICAAEPPQGLRIGFSATLGINQVAEPEALSHASAALGALEDALDGARVTRAYDVHLPPGLGLAWVKMMAAQARMIVLGEGGSTDEAGGGNKVPAQLAAAEDDRKLPALESSLVRSWDSIYGMLSLDDLGQAQRKLFELNEALDRVFASVDILATLAMPCDAFPADSSNLPGTLDDGETHFEDPLHPVFSMIPFNFSRHPACVVRCPGLSARTGMPWAIQLIAQRHQDKLLMQVAAAYERRSSAFTSWPQFQGDDSGVAGRCKL